MNSPMRRSIIAEVAVYMLALFAGLILGVLGTIAYVIFTATFEPPQSANVPSYGQFVIAVLAPGFGLHVIVLSWLAIACFVASRKKSTSAICYLLIFLALFSVVLTSRSLLEEFRLSVRLAVVLYSPFLAIDALAMVVAIGVLWKEKSEEYGVEQGVRY